MLGVTDFKNFKVLRNDYKVGAEVKMWNASRFCVSSLRRGHANLLLVIIIFFILLLECFLKKESIHGNTTLMKQDRIDIC